jgi:hypothetical protein
MPRTCLVHPYAPKGLKTSVTRSCHIPIQGDEFEDRVSAQPFPNPEVSPIRYKADAREPVTEDHSPCEHHQCRIQGNR